MIVKGIIFDFNRTLFNHEEEILFPESLPILKSFSQVYKLALISYGNKERKKLIDNLKIAKYFVSVQVVLNKKEKHFKQAAKALYCQFNEIMVVGDRVESEIKIANKLGMVSVWLKRNKLAPQNQTEKPQFTIASLSSLDLLLK